MRFLAVTGALFIALIGAIFAIPLLNSVVDFETNSAMAESALLLTSVEADVAETVSQVEVSAEAQAIPVTDIQTAAIPAITADEAVSLNTAVESADNTVLDAAARANAEAAAELAVFNEFVTSVSNGYDNLITGVYVANTLALPILQQPSGNPGHITMQESAATQFGMASDFGAIGIIAHNYLSGSEFFELEAGMEVYVIFGDGSYDIYLINEIRHFQALSPNSAYSNFLDLDNNNAQLSATQLFNQIYNQPGNLIFQTCIESNGLSTWGRIFVSAEQIGSSE